MTKPGSAAVPAQSALPWVPWLAGLAAFAPFLILHRYFAAFFWFGDEWDLLGQISQQGLGPWIWKVFAENFVPLFKIGWGGLVFIGDGSYFVMLAALWLTHAVNVALLGQWLRQEGFGWISSIFSMLIFGLASANIETLAWSVQWSAVLATTFFLGAAIWLGSERVHGSKASYLGILLALVSASALSFSRGVLTGTALALASIWPAPGSRAARAGQAALCLLPTVVVSGLIAAYATGNQTHLLDGSGTLRRVAQYGWWYFALNPGYGLFGCSSREPSTLFALGFAKVGLITWALWHTRGRPRRLLAVLLSYDLGNAVLLGIGRYHTGLGTVTSSRYQYASLLCTLPFAGCLLEDGLRLLSRAPLRLALATAVILTTTWLSARTWSRDLASWSDARGRVTRNLIFVDSNPPALGAVPGIPFLSTAGAKQIARQYHLH